MRAKNVYLVPGVVVAGLGIILLSIMQFSMSTLLKEVMQGLGITSISAGGVISTFPLLAGGVTSPFMGRLADKLRRRTLMVVALVIMSGFTLLTTVAASSGAMMLVRLGLGVGQGIFLPVYFAFLGSAFPKRRGLILGALGGLFTVGTGLNPMVTQKLYLGFGHHWQGPFLFYGLVGIALAIGVVLMAQTYEIGGAKSGAEPSVIQGLSSLFSRNMILVTVVMILWGLTNFAYLGTFTLFLRQHHYSLAAAVTITSVAGWASYAASALLGALSDKIGRRRELIYCGFISAVSGFLVFNFTQSFSLTLVLACLFQAFNGLFYPLGTGYAQDLARRQDIGVHSGTVIGMSHIMAGFSGLIAGALATLGGFSLVGVMLGVGSLAMAFCILLTKAPTVGVNHVMDVAEATS